jgi:hypothetical protein
VLKELIQGVQLWNVWEKMLNTWIEDQNQQHISVSMLLVKAKAHSSLEDKSQSNDNVKPFSASTG